MKSRATSFFNTIKSSVFQRTISRESTPANSPPRKGPLPVWEFAAQFFVPWNPEPIVEPEATVEPTPMEMDDMLPHSTFEDPMDTSKDPNIGENVEDEEAYGDEPDEPGMSDEDGEGEAHNDAKEKRWEPPTLKAAQAAHAKIKAIIHPLHDTGHGYKDPGLDLLLRSRLESMQQFLWAYIDVKSPFFKKWMAASLDIARTAERGLWFARRLREWTSAFIKDAEDLPLNIYGTWNKSRVDDEGLKQELFTHLQSIGKYISAMDVVCYMAQPDVQKRYGMKKGITEMTMRNWLSWIGFRWTLELSGQYVDGHERDDVVEYRQKVFLPRWKELEPNLHAWTQDGTEEEVGEGPQPQRLVVWFHDESMFYANNRRKKHWVHNSEKAVPRAKGEGASLMVADFVSADYGWL
jgi:hypothetical protein